MAEVVKKVGTSTTGGNQDSTTGPTSDSKKECTPEIQAEAQRLSDSISDIHVTRNTLLLELKGLDATSPSYAADRESTVNQGMQSLSDQMSKYIHEENKFAVDHKGSSGCIVVIKQADGKEEKITQTFPKTDEDAKARVTDRECEFTQLESDTWKEIQKISDDKPAIPANMSLPVNQSFSFNGYVKTTHEAFTFYNSGWYGVHVVAPITGTIVENANYSVKIRHNQNLSVKITGVLSQFRPGENLVNGNILGTTLPNIAGSIEFFVYMNGSTVCPLTFFSTTARQQILNVAWGTNPCSG